MIHTILDCEINFINIFEEGKICVFFVEAMMLLNNVTLFIHLSVFLKFFELMTLTLNKLIGL